MLQRVENEGILVAGLRQQGSMRRYGRGQALFLEGDPAERLFLLERGWVIISCTSSQGRENILGLCGPGDVLGEMSILDGQPRSASAVGLTPVDALVAGGAALTDALEDPRAAKELIRMLAGRLRDGDRKRLEFANLDTLGRVAERLLELSDRFGRPEGESTVIEIPLSQQQLASWCAASRESTVRALATLRSLNCITTARQRLVIHDLPAMRLHAGRLP
jgi:CRP/FNR family transcriptional regulator, cyclic AMP receptor protein